MKNNYVVMKFGGKSLARQIKKDGQTVFDYNDMSLFQTVAKFIFDYLQVHRGVKVIAVVSAMGEMTNSIYDKLNALYPDKNKRDLREEDAAVQLGEKQSAVYLTLALQNLNVSACSFDALQLDIQTQGGYKKARLLKINTDKIKQAFKKLDVVVVTGFQGMHEQEKEAIATLGRGGSDVTAIALAALLECPCQFYKKGTGAVQAFDPAYDSRAKKLYRMDYDQAIIMTEYGYGFLMTRSLEAAKRFGVPIEFKSTPGFEDDPFAPGTIIDAGPKQTIESLDEEFRAIGVKNGLVKIVIENIANVPGVSRLIYGQLSGIAFSDSSQFGLENNAAITIISDKENAERAYAKLNELKASNPDLKISAVHDLSMLTYIDLRISPESDFFFQLDSVLAKNQINIEFQNSSGKTIHTMLKTQDVPKAVKALADHFKLIE